MAEPENIRRVLRKLRPGTPRVTFELRSGDSVWGEFLELDGDEVRVWTGRRERRIPAESVAEILITHVSEGPE